MISSAWNIAKIRFEELRFRYMIPDDDKHIATMFVALNGQNIFQVMRHILDNEQEELKMLVNEGLLKLVCLKKVNDENSKFISMDSLDDDGEVEYIQSGNTCVVAKL